MSWTSRVVVLLVVLAGGAWFLVALEASRASAQTVTFPSAVTDTTATADCPASSYTYTDSDTLALAQQAENSCAAMVSQTDSTNSWGSAVVFTLAAFGASGLMFGAAATVKVLWSR